MIILAFFVIISNIWILSYIYDVQTYAIQLSVRIQALEENQNKKSWKNIE